jgi:hypothetical protein
MTPGQLAAGAHPYMRVDSEAVADLNVIWADRNYSMSGYVPSVESNRHKSSVTISPGLNAIACTVTPYDPRTYGVVLSARF